MKRLSIYISFLLSVTISSCFQQVFPEEKLVFSPKYLNLITPYKVGDTLKFEDSLHQIEIFAITKVDSIIFNKKGWFINARPYKEVSISYNQFPKKQWVDANTNADNKLVLLTIYPDNQEQSCDFSFKNFRGSIQNGKDTISSTSVSVNSLPLSNYYKVENVADDLAKSSDDIKTIYITSDKGIIAYQNQKGKWWKRIN